MTSLEEMQKELKETQEELRKATLARDVIEHEGWKPIELSLAELIRGLDTIREADLKTKGIEELMGRQIAIGILEEWLAEQKDLPTHIPDLMQNTDALIKRIEALSQNQNKSKGDQD